MYNPIRRVQLHVHNLAYRVRHNREERQLTSKLQQATTQTEVPLTRLEDLQYGMVVKYRPKDGSKPFIYGLVINDYRLGEAFAEAFSRGHAGPLSRGRCVEDLVDPGVPEGHSIGSQWAPSTQEHFDMMEVYQVSHSVLRGLKPETLRMHTHKSSNGFGHKFPFSDKNFAILQQLIGSS